MKSLTAQRLSGCLFVDLLQFAKARGGKTKAGTGIEGDDRYGGDPVFGKAVSDPRIRSAGTCGEKDCHQEGHTAGVKERRGENLCSHTVSHVIPGEREEPVSESGQTYREVIVSTGKIEHRSGDEQ